MEHDLSVILSWALNPIDTGRKLNVHKTFKKRPGTSYVRSIYVLVYGEDYIFRRVQSSKSLKFQQDFKIFNVLESFKVRVVWLLVSICDNFGLQWINLSNADMENNCSSIHDLQSTRLFQLFTDALVKRSFI